MCVVYGWRLVLALAVVWGWSGVVVGGCCWSWMVVDVWCCVLVGVGGGGWLVSGVYGLCWVILVVIGS